MPSASSVPSPTADFSEPDHLVPASVIPRWIGYGTRSESSRFAAIVFGTFVDLIEILKSSNLIERLHHLHELDRGRHQRFDGVVVLERVQMLGQRARIDPDPHRHAGLGGLDGDLGDLLATADVARVQPDAVRAGVDRLQREGVVEVGCRRSPGSASARRSSSAPRRPRHGGPRSAPGPPQPRRQRAVARRLGFGDWRQVGRLDHGFTRRPLVIPAQVGMARPSGPSLAVASNKTRAFAWVTDPVTERPCHTSTPSRSDQTGRTADTVGRRKSSRRQSRGSTRSSACSTHRPGRDAAHGPAGRDFANSVALIEAASSPRPCSRGSRPSSAPSAAVRAAAGSAQGVDLDIVLERRKVRIAPC